MANSDTIFALKGTSAGVAAPKRNQLAGLSVGNAESILTMGSDTSGTLVNAYLNIPTQTGIYGSSTPLNVGANPAGLLNQFGGTTYDRNVGAPYFNSSSFDGLAFRVRLSGNFTTGTSTATATIKIYQNTTAVLASGNNLVGTALVSTTHAATAGFFFVEVLAQWDSSTTLLNAVESWGNLGGNYVARGTQSVAAATVTAANFLGSFIVASVTFSANASGNLFNPVEFAIESV
jgi:hypothetical protein